MDWSTSETSCTLGHCFYPLIANATGYKNNNKSSPYFPKKSVLIALIRPTQRWSASLLESKTSTWERNAPSISPPQIPILISWINHNFAPPHTSIVRMMFQWLPLRLRFQTLIPEWRTPITSSQTIPAASIHPFRLIHGPCFNPSFLIPKQPIQTTAIPSTQFIQTHQKTPLIYRLFLRNSSHLHLIQTINLVKPWYASPSTKSRPSHPLRLPPSPLFLFSSPHNLNHICKTSQRLHHISNSRHFPIPTISTFHLLNLTLSFSISHPTSCSTSDSWSQRFPIRLPVDPSGKPHNDSIHGSSGRFPCLCSFPGAYRDVFSVPGHLSGVKEFVGLREAAWKLDLTFDELGITVGPFWWGFWLWFASGFGLSPRCATEGKPSHVGKWTLHEGILAL